MFLTGKFKIIILSSFYSEQAFNIFPFLRLRSRQNLVYTIRKDSRVKHNGKMKIGPPNRSHFVELLEYFGTSIDAYPPSCFLNELGPHFSPLSRFYTEGRSRSHLTRPEYEYCWLRKNSPTPKYLDAIVPHHLITNSPCCTRFCFPLLPFPHVIRFFFHHSPPITLHTFPFPCPTNSLLISWFVRISHLRYTCSRINYVGWWAFC